MDSFIKTNWIRSEKLFFIQKQLKKSVPSVKEKQNKLFSSINAVNLLDVLWHEYVLQVGGIVWVVGLERAPIGVQRASHLVEYDLSERHAELAALELHQASATVAPDRVEQRAHARLANQVADHIETDESARLAGADDLRQMDRAVVAYPVGHLAQVESGSRVAEIEHG